MSLMSTTVTTFAEPIIEIVLKKLTNSAIRHLGRDAVEEIAREVIREEMTKISPQQIYSPTLVINLTVAIDDVYAMLGNDNRFQVTENSEIVLSETKHPLLNEPNIDETRLQITRTRNVSMTLRHQVGLFSV